MKKLILIRHAKSAWDKPWMADHDRALAARGLRDAPKMAKRLKTKGIIPDLILSSSAERAKQTALLIAKEFALEKSCLNFEKNLFHAAPSTILKYIRMQKDSHETLFVIGHNPGFNELIQLLGQPIDNLPTTGTFGFKLLTDHWGEVSSSNVSFWFFDFPKSKS